VKFRLQVLGRRVLQATAIGAVCVLSATACSSSSKSAGSTTSSSAAAGSSSAGATTAAKLTILRSTGTTFEPLYIAQSQGYFKAANLDVTITPGALDTSQNIPRVVSGGVQLSMTDGPGLIKAVAGGLPVQAITAIQAAASTLPLSDGLLVPAGSKIKSVLDTQGKTIGTPALGGLLTLPLQAAVKKAGGDPSKIKFVALPLTALQDSAKSGKVDGIVDFAAFYQAAQKAGFKSVGNGSNDLPGAPQALVYASKSWLAKNADVATRFAGALAKAETYANAHPAAVRAVDTKYTQLPAAAVASRFIQPFAPKIDKAAMVNLSNLMKEVAVTKKAPTGDDLIWSQAATS
jgi:NitT/TauT family transport system substrate-binding protein